jgi:hypothetical protein
MATAVGMAGVATYKIASCFAAGVCETQVYKTGRLAFAAATWLMQHVNVGSRRVFKGWMSEKTLRETYAPITHLF